jgi:hypothetical protein
MERLIRESIREHYGQMPDSVNQHANAAGHDLYFGPYDADFWRIENGDDSLPDYSFAESCRIVGEWLEETYPGALWVCGDSACVMLAEPTGEWYNPETDEYSDEHMGDGEGWEYYEPGTYYEIDRELFARAYILPELYPYL